MPRGCSRFKPQYVWLKGSQVAREMRRDLSRGTCSTEGRCRCSQREREREISPHPQAATPAALFPHSRGSASSHSGVLGPCASSHLKRTNQVETAALSSCCGTCQTTPTGGSAGMTPPPPTWPPFPSCCSDTPILHLNPAPPRHAASRWRTGWRPLWCRSLAPRLGGHRATGGSSAWPGCISALSLLHC